MSRRVEFYTKLDPEFGGDYVNSASIAGFRYEKVKNGDSLRLPLNNIMVKYDSYIENPVIFTIRSDNPAGFTYQELYEKICKRYEIIYIVEEMEVGHPGQTSATLVNRTRSNGIFAIFGHDLGDLVIHAIEKEPRHAYWTIDLSS